MPNTYTQIHIHVVFTVQNRQSLIASEWKIELYKYITAIIQNHHHKLIAINGMPDHVHMLFGLRPTQALSELMQDVKGSSSKWINEKHFVKGKFSWQEGYGAFSYSKSQLNQVIDYINRQEEHHKQKAFLEEYRDFLNAFRIDYDEKYLFKVID